MVMNDASGPSGLTYDPGTGLPEELRGRFFLADFRGGPAMSSVHAIKLAPKGAGFEVVEQKPIFGNVLCTDVARDGAMGGPNLGLYRTIQSAWPSIALQASGGIHNAADLEALAATGVAAAISGKALLEKHIRFQEIRPFLPNA